MRAPGLVTLLYLCAAAAHSGDGDGVLKILDGAKPQPGVNVFFFGAQAKTDLGVTGADGGLALPSFLNLGKPGTTALVKSCPDGQSVFVIDPGVTLPPWDEGCRKEAQGQGHDADDDCKCRKAPFLWNPVRVDIHGSGGFFGSPWTYVVPAVLAGGGVLATQGGGSGTPAPTSPPSPGTPPAPGSGTPPPSPSQVPVEVVVADPQLTRVYHGFATRPMDTTARGTFRRETNNCASFFVPRFDADLWIRGSGLGQAFPAEARAEGSFMIGGVPTTGRVEVGISASDGRISVKEYLTPQRPGGSCTDVFEAMLP